MNSPPETLELARKFVSTFHLSVPERAAFSPSGIPGSLVTASLLALLQESPVFPPQWKGALFYDGGLIEVGDDGECQVTGMGEVGVGRFEVSERQRFASISEGVANYARRAYGKTVDGITIDWTQ